MNQNTKHAGGVVSQQKLVSPIFAPGSEPVHGGEHSSACSECFSFVYFQILARVFRRAFFSHFAFGELAVFDVVSGVSESVVNPYLREQGNVQDEEANAHQGEKNVLVSLFLQSWEEVLHGCGDNFHQKELKSKNARGIQEPSFCDARVHGVV